MEANSWRPASGEPAAVDPGAAGDWRSHLQPEARQRIVNKIMETLKKHLPINAPEGLSELQKIAIRFEEKIYTAATGQPDYLRKISLKMLTMEKPQQTPQIIPASPTLGMQSQVSNQGQSLAVPLINQSSGRQSLLSQNLHNNNTAPVQASANLPSALSSVTGLSQPMSGVSHAPNIQSMSVMPQNSMANSMGQGGPVDSFTNAQRQMQGRQQQEPIIPQQQQQSQNQLIYQQQHLLKQKLQKNAPMQPHIQQQQQQSLMAAQLQSSQQSLIQSSSIQMGQSTIQQTQQATIQSVSQSGLQQNQLNPIQQSVPSLHQQQQQSIARQPQQTQSSLHQQGSLQPSVSHQTTMALQQQHLMGQPANIPNMQQAQLLGQQNNSSDMQQQQRLLVQQNNHMNQSQQMFNQQTMPLQPQQQIGSQNNMAGLQQQPPQLLGNVSSISNLQPNQRQMQILQQQKTAAQQQQQQAQQTTMAMMQPQAQQSQLQQSQQHLISQFQSQPTQLQQSLTMSQQPNSLPREMQQRLQASAALLQQQNAIEQQKQFIQPQRGIQEVSSSTSMDSTAQTGHSSGADWQEEIYQKIKFMKEQYFAELSEIYQKLSLKLQQLDSLGPPAKPSDQYERVKHFKLVLERYLGALQISKSSIQISLKDKLPIYEKQILNILASHKKKPMPPQGQQQFQGHGIQQQQTPQVTQLQQHDNHTNQLQHMNLQANTTSTIQSIGTSNMQHGNVPSSSNFGVPTAQQNITNSVQSGANLEPIQGSSFSSLQQGAMGSLQQGGVGTMQNAMNGPQQANANILSHSSLSTMQPSVNSAQLNANAIQQHLKQQQQEQQAQQMKQFQQRQMQLFQQKQQMLQQQLPLQQQLHQQQKQQQAAQMPLHQVSQLHQVNEVNDLKVRQGPGMKPGVYQQHYSAGQRGSYFHPQMKPCAPFPISSPPNLQTSSPQLSHPSPQIDQHSVLSSQIKAGTPLQSASSPFAPSPSPPIVPSPIPGESDKPLSNISSLSNAGQIGHPQTTVAPQAQSLAVGTPGISASPLLAEFASTDANQANLPTQVPGKLSATERPLDRLIKAVRSATTQAFCSAVSDIGSVVSMIDRIAGSAPGNGSRAAVGEDLVAMTKCRLQARNFISQDGNSSSKKMKRDTSAMPLNYASSVGSANDSFKQSCGLGSELQSTATSRVKRNKVEVNHALLEEIQDINQQLIYTAINISEDDADSISAVAEDGEGTVIKCTFTATPLSSSLKSQIASAQTSPILPLRLLVPANYPKCSPILLDKLPDEQRDSDDLSAKTKSRFNILLRGLMQPMSLEEMVRAWDACARKVIAEFAQQSGGGSFSSTYGTWENCVGA